jgi:hypothetical protein
MHVYSWSSEYYIHECTCSVLQDGTKNIFSDCISAAYNIIKDFSSGKYLIYNIIISNRNKKKKESSKKEIKVVDCSPQLVN